jgi:hypothetical protein
VSGAPIAAAAGLEDPAYQDSAPASCSCPLICRQRARAARRGLQSLRKPEPLPLELWAHRTSTCRRSRASAKSSGAPGRSRSASCIAWARQHRGIHVLQVGAPGLHEVPAGRHRLHRAAPAAQPGPVAAEGRRSRRLRQDRPGPDAARREDHAHVFPKAQERSKDNTLLQKKFLGSLLKLRGGHAAGNYRRLTLAKGRARRDRRLRAKRRRRRHAGHR